MKGLKKIEGIIVICLLFALNSCSNDTGLEIIEDSSQLELNQDIQSKSGVTCDIELLVTYSFNPFASEEYKTNFIEAFRLEMAQEFTICTEIEVGRECPNLEKWTVNLAEYDAYLVRVKNGTSGGGTSNTSNGSAKLSVIKPGGGGIAPRDNDCFTSVIPE